MNKRISSLFLFMVITAFLVLALLKISNENNAFFENYHENAQKNIINIKNFFNRDADKAYSGEAASDEPSAVLVDNADNTNDTEQTEEPSAQTEEPIGQAGTLPAATENVSSNKSIKNVPFENAKNIKYAVYKNYLVCANKTSLMAFDKYGNSKWAVAVSFSEPILKTSGNYILVADKGGKTLSLFVGEKLVYSVNTENIINYASISPKGEAVVVTEKEQYLSCVAVYNQEGDIIFSRNVGSGEVITAAVSSSRRVAAAILNTDTGVSSQIQIWNINFEDGHLETSDLNDTLAFGTEFSRETLAVISDKGIYGFNGKCKNIWTVSPESGNDKIMSVRSDKSGRRITVFDNGVNAYIKISDIHGIQRKFISSEIIPDFADICYPVTAYNNDRNVIFGKYNKPLKTYTSDKDIFGGLLIDSGSLVIIHSTSLEFIDINKF